MFRGWAYISVCNDLERVITISTISSTFYKFSIFKIWQFERCKNISVYEDFDKLIYPACNDLEIVVTISTPLQKYCMFYKFPILKHVTKVNMWQFGKCKNISVHEYFDTLITSLNKLVAWLGKRGYDITKVKNHEKQLKVNVYF